MSISGLFNSANNSNLNNIKYGETINSNSASKTQGQSDNASIQPGTSITGKVVSSQDGNVTVDVNGKLINARLEGNASLNKGETVTFDVKGNSNNQITLTPLYTNTVNTSTAIKALSYANLPITENSISMADTMISQNMKIDSQSLSAMYRQVSAYPETAPSLIVEMKQFGIEINPDNVESFQAFKNYENQVTSGINDIMNSIPDAFKELATKGDNIQFTNFALDVINTFNGENADATLANNNVINNVANNSVNDANMQVIQKTVISDNTTTILDMANDVLDNSYTDVINMSSDRASSGNVLGNSDSLSQTLLGKDAAANVALANEELGKIINSEQGLSNTILNKDIVSADLSNKVIIDANDVTGNTTEKLVDESGTLNKQDAYSSLTTFEKSNLVDVLKQSGLDVATASKLIGENATAKDFLDATKSLLENGKLTDNLKELISSDKFGNILKSQMQNQWLLTPIDVGQKDTVENLYRRLNEQTKELTQALSNNALENTALSANLSDMSNNLDFMNQMNNVYQYIQLPLKMNGSEATGDLFVYTDKKSLARNDGNVSALLHLDMDNLGPLDVYASITPGNNVFTKFCVADEATLDFIEANINILNERLEKRGYSMKSETTIRNSGGGNGANDSTGGPIDNNAKKIMKYSFDMRA